MNLGKIDRYILHVLLLKECNLVQSDQIDSLDDDAIEWKHSTRALHFPSIFRLLHLLIGVDVRLIRLLIEFFSASYKSRHPNRPTHRSVYAKSRSRQYTDRANDWTELNYGQTLSVTSIVCCLIEKSNNLIIDLDRYKWH